MEAEEHRGVVTDEPLTRLVAAVELEHAAHAAQRSFIRQARETSRSWYEISQALDLLWHAFASNESDNGEAYDYALRYDWPEAGPGRAADGVHGAEARPPHPGCQLGQSSG